MALSPVNCSSQAIPYPALPGATIRTLSASLARTAFQYIPAGLYANHDAVVATNTSYCNVTITYTPLDSNNKTTVQVWLPTQKWNGRMQGLGGGGWSAGLFDFGYPGMLAAVAQGYAAVATNGGWTSNRPRDFALLRPGTVDTKSLQHFASTSLNDMSIIGKSVIQSFYGQPPRYSYWNGCSQGGRQGFMLAQQYPHAFSGLAIGAPAINWSSLMIAGFYAQALMHTMGNYPDPCEISTLTAAAIKACDGNDGIVDGLISDPDSCHFDPYTLVNTTTSCLGSGNRKISKEAAYLANTAWTGMKNISNQSLLQDGNSYEASLVTSGGPLLDSVLNRLNITMGLADRQCSADGTCTGRPLDLVDDWIRWFVKKDPNYDSSKMTMKEFDEIAATSVREYTAIIGTGSTDLSGFRNAGGKLLSYHGLVSLAPCQFMVMHDN
jgi:Tannase and feruloyl esterase